MNRLQFTPVAEATGHAAQLFAAIKSAVGMVPNAYVGIGSNSPHALEAALNLDAALKKGGLDGREIEAIKLVVSDAADCDYCLAAHTVLGQQAGVSAETLAAAQIGQSSDPRTAAALAFALKAVTQRAQVSDADVAQLHEVGFGDEQVVELLAHVALNLFTNYVNVAFQVPVDFPPVPLSRAA